MIQASRRSVLRHQRNLKRNWVFGYDFKKLFKSLSMLQWYSGHILCRYSYLFKTSWYCYRKIIWHWLVVTLKNAEWKKKVWRNIYETICEVMSSWHYFLYFYIFLKFCIKVLKVAWKFFFLYCRKKDKIAVKYSWWISTCKKISIIYTLVQHINHTMILNINFNFYTKISFFLALFIF